MDIKDLRRKLAAAGFMVEESKDLAAKISARLPEDFPDNHPFYLFDRSLRIIGNQEGLKNPLSIRNFVIKNLDELFEIVDMDIRPVQESAEQKKKREKREAKEKTPLAQTWNEAGKPSNHKGRTRLPFHIDEIIASVRSICETKTEIILTDRVESGPWQDRTWSALNARIRLRAADHPEWGFNSIASLLKSQGLNCNVTTRRKSPSAPQPG